MEFLLIQLAISGVILVVHFVESVLGRIPPAVPRRPEVRRTARPSLGLRALLQWRPAFAIPWPAKHGGS